MNSGSLDPIRDYLYNEKGELKRLLIIDTTHSNVGDINHIWYHLVSVHLHSIPYSTPALHSAMYVGTFHTLFRGLVASAVYSSSASPVVLLPKTHFDLP